jgi:phage shock protein C
MADDFPVPEHRYDPGRDRYAVEQPASRTRFYRDKRNGKVLGVCAGIADYTGFDVSLVRVCFLAAVLMSGGSILPLYFIVAMVTPTVYALNDGQRGKVGGRPRPPARCSRHPFADERHRSSPCRYRKLCDDRNRSLAREIEQLR